MSLITDDPEDSPRDCSTRSSRKHHHGSSSSRGRRALIIGASSTVLSLAFIILWLTLRPSSSPSFSLLDATATATTNNASVILVVDAAFTARNPNAHAAALYDQLQASASYAGVPLSAGAPLPPLDHPSQGDVVLSALLTSSTRSPTPSNTAAVAVGGRALLRVRIEGQLRWKVAAWVSGRHGLVVDCIAAVLLQPRVGAVQQQGWSSSSSQCATHVL